MKYTGTLRAFYPLSPTRSLPSHIQRPDYADTGIPISEIKVKKSTEIMVLNAEEIETSRRVGRLAREVLDTGARAIRPGITTDEIDRIIHEACLERECYPSPLNYYHFPKSCCTSVNEVICHGIPDQRPLQDGDIVNIDVTVYKDGFHSDLNETYFVGNVDDRAKSLVQTTRECLDLAIKLGKSYTSSQLFIPLYIVKPGFLYRDLGAVIEKHAKSRGFSVVRTYCGHGINRLFHPAPNIPHYASTLFILKPIVIEM